MKDLENELQTGFKNKFYDNEKYRALMNQACSDPEVKAFTNEHHISSDAIRHSASKIYEFVQQRDKVKNGTSGLIPGYQPQLVFDGHLIDISYVPTPATLEKQREKSIKNRIRSIAMPKQAKSATFSNYDSGEDNRVAIIKAAMDFVNEYTKSPHHFVQGMYLNGPFGVGKTFTLGAIANELARKNVATTMVHFPSFVVEMKNSISDHTSADKLDAVKKAQVLMIDDIGADVMSNWVRDDVLGVILEYRMQNELPTFFTSNLSMDNLERDHLPYDKQNSTSKVRAERIMQRIRYLAKEYVMLGKNRRLEQK